MRLLKKVVQVGMYAIVPKNHFFFSIRTFFGLPEVNKQNQQIRHLNGNFAAMQVHKTYCRRRFASSSSTHFFGEHYHGLMPQKTAIKIQGSNRFFAEKFGRLIKSLSEDNENKTDWGDPDKAKLLLFITSNFYEEIKKYDSLMVFFLAKWCGHCKKLKRPYAEAALMLQKSNLPGTFAVFDIMSDPDVADKENIVGVPLLKYFRKGKFISVYGGKRTAEDLFNFMKDPPTRPIRIKRIEI